MANSLCPLQQKHTMYELEVHIANCGSTDDRHRVIPNGPLQLVIQRIGTSTQLFLLWR